MAKVATGNLVHPLTYAPQSNEGHKQYVMHNRPLAIWIPVEPFRRFSATKLERRSETSSAH